MVSLKRDLAVAAIWLAIGLTAIALGIHPLWSAAAALPPTTTTAVLTLLGLVVLAVFRSRVPTLTLALAVPIVVVDVLHGGTVGVVVALTDLIYAAVKYSSDERLRLMLKITILLTAACLLALILTRPEAGIYQLTAQWALIIAISAIWGWNVRSERARTSADLLARHYQQQVDLQERIAHDLHDLVANHIAVAGLHIEAAKLLYASPERDSAKVLETLAKAKAGTDHAHTELRNLIDVLSAAPGGGGEVDPATLTLDHLLPAGRELEWVPDRPTLEERLASFGSLKSGVLARVLTEAIANAVKHGSGDIAVEINENQLTVSNPISGSPSTGGEIGGGAGLVGARKLLESIGGELLAGAGPGEEPGGQLGGRHSGRPRGTATWRTAIILPERSQRE